MKKITKRTTKNSILDMPKEKRPDCPYITKGECKCCGGITEDFYNSCPLKEER